MGLYRGIQGEILGIPLYELVGTSAVELSSLPASVQDQLEDGIRVRDEAAGREAIDAYHRQIEAEIAQAEQVAQTTRSETEGDIAPEESSSGDTASGGAASGEGAADAGQDGGE